MTDRRKEASLAENFFKHLTAAEIWDLGDQLVLGSFDWRDWMESKPSGVFLRELDRQRVLWEMGQK